MKLIKILGIGSPFGDDQAGWRVVELLKDHVFMQPNIYEYVEMACCDRPGTRLIELMYNTNRVFLIDAVKSGNTIGLIHRLKNDEIQELNCLMSTHHVGVAEALQLGRALNELPENIILYGIEIDNIELHSTISEAVEQAIKQVALLLKNEIINLLNMKGITV